jgi:aryl-alcohol dehydrogenase-like predicted oxidoreductase
MLQGRVLGRLPPKLRAKFPPDLTDAQRALQFARSAPGVTATLAGMSHPAHVDENLRLRDVAPMAPAEFAAVIEG